MTEENKNEVEEVIVEETKQLTKSKGNKVSTSSWSKFFNDNYNLPIDLSVLLVKYFDDNVGEDYRVDAEFDHFYQKNVIKILIEYSKSLENKEGETWHNHYTQLANEFNGKSIGTILKGVNKDA